MSRMILFVCGCLIGLLANAQSTPSELSYEAYLRNLLQHHPLAKQANLNIDLAEAEWLKAKGGFDPSISSNWDQKDFDKKRYYRHFQGQVKIPTRLGMDIVGGYENTDGIFLNPENTTDPNGLWNVGLEVNLLQGFLVNERRMALEQAKVFRQLSENKQEGLLNNLLYASSLAYLEWQKYHAFQNVIEENLQLAQAYFENTKLSFENGEKTAMDTLEALIMLQDANSLLQANDAASIKAQQNLENFLWLDELPQILQEGVIPQNYRDTLFNFTDTSSIDQMVANNPMLLEKQNKQSLLEVKQKLKREKLKPKLKIKYNPLIATADENLLPDYSFADRKWGIDFSMPLFFRKERADVQIGKIKLAENQLDIENKTNELLNKVENSLRQQRILQEQLNIQEQSVAGYRQLLDGENEKFSFGESSVFLVNKRQEKYISGQLKLISMVVKLQMEVLTYLYLTNRLLND